jgi:hypothetical protein
VTLSGENLNPHASDPALADDPPSSLDGQLLARRERRRMDLHSFDGLLREHAHLYRRFKAGQLGLKRFDAASRALRRQGELLRDRDAKALIERELAATQSAITSQRTVPTGLVQWYNLLDTAQTLDHPAAREIEFVGDETPQPPDAAIRVEALP